MGASTLNTLFNKLPKLTQNPDIPSVDVRVCGGRDVIELDL